MLKKDYTVPLFLCLFFFILAACFLIRDGVPFAHDDINHFRHSLDFREIFAGDGSLAAKCARVTQYDNPFPPLFFILTVLIFSVAGVSAKAAMLTNLLLMPLFLLSFFLLARKISGRTGASLLAAVSVLSFPLVTAMSRLYYLDFALLVFITLAYTFLLLSNRCEKFLYVALFGIASGLALLCKWTAVLFLAGGYIYLIVDHVRGPKNRRLAHFFIAALLAVIVSGWWYAFHFQDITGRYDTAVRQHGADAWAGLEPDLSAYIPFLFYGVGPYFWILILAGFLIALQNRRRYLILLALWFLLPCLALSFLPAKLPRYMLPALPALALPLLEFGGPSKKRHARWGRRVLMAVCFITALSMTFFAGKKAAFPGFSPAPEHVLLDNQRSAFRIGAVENRRLYRDILEAVIKDEGPEKSLAVIPYEGYFLTRDILRYHASTAGWADALLILSPYRLPDQFQPLHLFDASYYLVKTGRQFYLDEAYRTPLLSRYLGEVTRFLSAHREGQLESIAVFESGGEQLSLLKLKEAWRKTDILAFLAQMEQILPGESFTSGMERYRLKGAPGDVLEAGAPPSIFLAKGAKRISNEIVIPALPYSELVLYPGLRGGGLSLTCEHHPLPHGLADPASSTAVSFFLNGEEAASGTILPDRPVSFHLDLHGASEQRPVIVTVRVRSDPRRKEIPHRFKPSNLLILKDIRYQ